MDGFAANREEGNPMNYCTAPLTTVTLASSDLAYRKRRALFLWGVIVVGLLLAAPYTTAANAQGHVRPGLPNPPTDCGVVNEKSQPLVARTPEGRIVVLKNMKKAVVMRMDSGLLHACWNEPERGGSR